MELERLHQEQNTDGDAVVISKDKFETQPQNGLVTKVPKRDVWNSRFQFLLAIVGYTVGIGSVWRFPMMCARNGTGTFLILFFFFLAICGYPLYYIEVCLGQFCGMSAGRAFEFCSLFRGIGFLMVVISFNVLWYYVSIMGWIQYYFVNSFYSQLPWSTCGNWWNTPQCKEGFSVASPENTTISNWTDVNMTSLPYHVTTEINVMMPLTNVTSKFTSASTEFWLYNVLRQSDSLDDMGTIQWHLVLSNFIAWALVVASLIKGVKSLGKFGIGLLLRCLLFFVGEFGVLVMVVYITATAPYILLTVLLIRGLTLDGAVDGVMWYITPDFTRLSDPQVWMEAAVQVFYSLGPTWGGVITMASHNKFNQKSMVETVICVASDGFTAFYAGLVVFTCTGFMAKEAGVSAEELAKASGPGLAFIAYPEAISRMPLPQLWAVLFFLTLITVMFDSTFGMFETVTGAIVDTCPKLVMKYKWFKYFVLVATALLLFLLSIPLCVSGGIYLFQLSDWYISAFALLFGSALECIIVCWIYGADRFAKDIELMTGRRASKLMRFFWCIVMTGCLSVGFIITVCSQSEPKYGNGVTFQPYAISIGMIMAFLPFIPIAVIMVKEIYLAEGPVLERIPKLLQPSSKWGPSDTQAKEIYRIKPYRYEDTLFKRIKMNIFGDKDTPWV